MAENVELGSTVIDKITNFKGVVVGRSVWLYGCVRLAIQGTAMEKGKPAEAVWIDEGQVDVVKPPAKGLVNKEQAAKKPAGPRQDDRR